jgi:hypothetical protein
LTEDDLVNYIYAMWDTDVVALPGEITRNPFGNLSNKLVIRRKNSHSEYIAADVKQIDNVFNLRLSHPDKDAIDHLRDLLMDITKRSGYVPKRNAVKYTYNFEDSSLAGWTLGSGGLNPAISSTQAHGGTKSVKCVGSGDHNSYLWRTWVGKFVHEVEFCVRADNQSACVVVCTLDGVGGEADKLWLEFYDYLKLIMDKDGHLHDSFGNNLEWSPNTWYHVKIVDDGSGHGFIYLDNVLISATTGYLYASANLANSVTFENWFTGHGVYFDDISILVTDQPITLPAIVGSPNLEIESMGNDSMRNSVWNVRYSAVSIE